MLTYRSARVHDEAVHQRLALSSRIGRSEDLPSGSVDTVIRIGRNLWETKARDLRVDCGVQFRLARYLGINVERQ